MISVFFSFILFFIFSSLLHKHTRMTVTMEHTDEVNQHLSETFHLVLSCLIFSFVFSSTVFSLSSFSVSVSVSVCWWCVCRCVWLCVFVWCCVVWCGVWCVVWHAENPVCRLKTPPCEHSKRPRVCRQHAHMHFNMCAWCRHRQRRFESSHGNVFESTHGGVFESTHGWSSPVQFTKKSRT